MTADSVAYEDGGQTLVLGTPRAFVPLLQPARYKGAWGGRGSGKSHFFAELMVERAYCEDGFRAVCIREFQKSLQQSVKRLIEDKIQSMGLGDAFRVMESEIRGPGGGLIIFQGMQNHTADSIKSLEGFDVAWVEEAQALSKHSLRLLRPTIRKPGSEIWFSWNPASAEDPVDLFMRGQAARSEDDDDPDGKVICVKVNWSDNPWFPAVLDKERRRDRDTNPDEYDHIWEGAYQTISDAVIFKGKVEVREFGPPPYGTRLFYGADWGFAKDPTALVRFFILDRTLYIEHEAFGHEVEIDQTPALFDTIPEARKWPIKGDPARPETISYMRRHGFNVTPAAKWQGCVEDGIAHMKGFEKIVVHERCPQIAREFRLYSYKVDRVTEQVLPIIVDAENHGIDAVRYGLDGYIQRKGPLNISDDLLRRASIPARR